MSKYRKKSAQPLPASKLQEVASIFSALSHPHRLSIFLRLASRCSPKASVSEFEAKACVSDAGKGLNIAPSTLSHHIKELRQAGLVRMEKSGKTTDCWVEFETIERLKTFFESLGCSK